MTQGLAGYHEVLQSWTRENSNAVTRSLFLDGIKQKLDRQSLGRYDTEETEEQDPGFGGRRRMTWHPILVVIFYESSSAEQTDKQGPIRYQR